MKEQLVIVPKSSFKDGSRSSLRDLAERAQFTNLARGKFDREDEIREGNFVFRGIEGPDALAIALENTRNVSAGIIFGADVLEEARLQAGEYGFSPSVTKLLPLNAGQCSLNILAPVENPVQKPSDLTDRRIFTSFPHLLDKLLQEWGINARVRRTKGADTRVKEARAENNDLNTAAFEIVGSGETARINCLQIVRNEAFYPNVGVADLSNIQTDLFVTNVQTISASSRAALQMLGSEIESALEQNLFVTFTFHVPASEVRKFEDLGMSGPTISRVLTRDGSELSSLMIAVPAAEEMATNHELARRGVKDPLVSPLMRGKKGRSSEVYKVLPFTNEQP